MSLPIEQPPPETEQQMSDYLVRQFVGVRDALDATTRLPSLFAVPAKPRNGDVRYFGQAIPPQIQYPGFWGYENGRWVPLGQAAYGGIVKINPTNYGTVADGVWTTVDNWTGELLANSLAVTQDFAASGLRIERPGLFSASIEAVATFDEAQQGRTLLARIRDVTLDLPGLEIPVFVGRNTQGANISQSAYLFEISELQVGNLYQLEVAGQGASFTNFEVVYARFSATGI